MSINITVYTFYFRPNIFLSVGNKGANVRKDLQFQMIQQGNKFQFEGPTIIYCPTKKITDHIATVVNGKSALFDADAQADLTSQGAPVIFLVLSCCGSI